MTTGIVEGNTWKFFHDPDEIASYFQSQSTTFLHFLHENYMNTIGSIGEAETCADIMSLSDTITNEWRVGLIFLSFFSVKFRRVPLIVFLGLISLIHIITTGRELDKIKFVVLHTWCHGHK